MKALAIALALLSTGCKRHCWQDGERVVADIGGCNKNGGCAVRFTDGTTGYMTLPLVGKRERVWRPCG
jgi:hypothetical protein